MDALVRKLGLAADLSERDIDAVRSAIQDVRDVPARSVLINKGERPEHVHVVLEGFAYQYKLLGDGNRQILTWLVPGDFCDLQEAVLGATMSHTVATVSASTVARIPAHEVGRLFATSHQLSHGLLWTVLVQEAILQEWLVSLGRRDAESRLAHVLCELHARLDAIGRVHGSAFAFPLTQSELADTLGVTLVHMNRTLQSLRRKGVMEWRRKRLVMHDLAQLCERAEFDPGYLHFERRPPPSP